MAEHEEVPAALVTAEHNGRPPTLNTTVRPANGVPVALSVSVARGATETVMLRFRLI